MENYFFKKNILLWYLNKYLKKNKNLKFDIFFWKKIKINFYIIRFIKKYKYIQN